MEPADQRRDDLAGHIGSTVALEPQWSPPTSGGTTPGVDVDRPRRLGAAMEPADQRRDDGWYEVGLQWPPRAAMEPADQRRDDLPGP